MKECGAQSRGLRVESMTDKAERELYKALRNNQYPRLKTKKAPPLKLGFNEVRVVVKTAHKKPKLKKETLENIKTKLEQKKKLEPKEKLAHRKYRTRKR